MNYTTVEIAIRDIERFEEALKPVLELARIAHCSAMRASEKIGEHHGTGAAHACLGLMEASRRALSQANDTARYSRHSMQYPPSSRSTGRKDNTL